MRGEPRIGRHHLLERARQRRRVAATDRGRAQHAERQRRGIEHLATGDARKIEAAAAQVSDNAVGIRNGRNHAQARRARLVIARQDRDIQTQRLDLAGEFLAIAGIAHRRGRHADGLVNIHLARDDPKALERLDRARHRWLVDHAGLRQRTPQPRHDLFVENQRRIAPRAGEDHQAHRVRADIDDRGAVEVNRLVLLANEEIHDDVRLNRSSRRVGAG